MIENIYSTFHLNAKRSINNTFFSIQSNPQKGKKGTSFAVIDYFEKLKKKKIGIHYTVQTKKIHLDNFSQYNLNFKLVSVSGVTFLFVYKYK